MKEFKDSLTGHNSPEAQQLTSPEAATAIAPNATERESI
jgi:hypothetical protein